MLTKLKTYIERSKHKRARDNNLILSLKKVAHSSAALCLEKNYRPKKALVFYKNVLLKMTISHDGKFGSVAVKYFKKIYNEAWLKKGEIK